jgi:RNA polymerase sigma-70 factor (ECF subfamily)
MPTQARQDTQLADFEASLTSLRPELHRYCARMTGSVVDGEDVLQDALYNATQAIRGGVAVENFRAWLFRIAHNTALNYLRSRKNDRAMKDKFSTDMPSFDLMPMRSEVKDALRPFLDLTPKQRSTVILRDVLGYAAAEVAHLTGSSVQSVKSALHRGRVLLKSRAPEEDTVVAPLPETERKKLSVYARYFNTHDFDRLRDMLSAEVRLELVSKERRKGKEGVSGYFGNYQKRLDWVMAPGCVDGRPAILAFDRDDPSASPGYFVLLEFDGDNVASIRDFRYARYAMADARWERF